MNIINLDQLISMTSKEIAELTGKRHDNVIRDVRKMLDEIYPDGGLLSFEDTYVNTQNGETYSMYRLDRKHTFILVAGYSVQLRAKCYDHIQMLEQKVLRLEDQQKRAAVQSANRRGVTWGDYCKTHGLPAQKLMNILKRERKIFQVHPVSGEW
ncbi:Rha family transcriptional regulator, partial [Klebsiella pneumoniae]|uniref:Rha family transcriptional regulator n=1 Tax=Klebsiella pneumoniae TaxID=573 RepID=UPI002FF40BC2